jgi:hypothetical protein
MENRVGERALLLGVAASRMFVAMLAFMPAIFVAYWIAVRDVAGRMPVTASFAALAFATWFLLEVLPRPFDLWVVVASRCTPACPRCSRSRTRCTS